MAWSTILLVSVVYSLIVFAGLSAMVVVGGLASNDAMLHDYPPAIQDRHGPKSARGRLVTKWMSAAGLLMITVASIGVIWYLRDQLGGDIGFWPGFIVGLATMIIVNVLDLVILDFWLFCNVQPKFMVPESTRGMPEYRDFSFHWKVMVPKPVPWPLLLIPAYGGILGLGTVAFEAVR